jgi:hypothetical protein
MNGMLRVAQALKSLVALLSVIIEFLEFYGAQRQNGNE